MSSRSSKMRYLIPALVLLIGATALLIGTHLSKKQADKNQEPSAAQNVLEQAAQTTQDKGQKSDTQKPAEAFTPVIQPQGRFLGNKEAPIHMIEFSSLSCTHCAHFHTNILDEFRVKYVDTGKVRIEFRSFPLNQQALDGLKLLNCLPEEQYFPFMTMLFQTQNHWAFSKNYLDTLKQDAKLAGLSDARIESCLGDKAAEEKLVNGLLPDIQKYKLQSTPTFILNEGAETVVGAGSIEDFDKKIQPLLAKLAAPNTETPKTENKGQPAP